MKKILWTLLLLGIVGVASVAAWQGWKAAQKNALPEGIVVRERANRVSIQVDVAAKYGHGRITGDPAAREGGLPGRSRGRSSSPDGRHGKSRRPSLRTAQGESRGERGDRRRGRDRDHEWAVRSELKQAEQEFNRSKNLFTKRVIAREEYDQYKTRWETAEATLNGAKAKLRTATQSISAAEAEVKRTEVKIEDSILKSPVKGRVLYRLAEPAEVVALGGKVLTLINLGDIYMEIYLPSQEAARVKMGADGRIVLDARPEIRRPGEGQLCLAGSPVHPGKQARDPERARRAHVPRQAQGASRDRGCPLYRADQDERPGNGLRAARRTRWPGPPSLERPFPKQP